MINSEKLTESVLAAIRHQVTLLVEAEKVLSNAELASSEQIGIKILDSQITALEAELERYSNLKIRLYQDLCDDVVSREEYGEMNIEKAFSHGNPWLMKFRAISIPEKLERTHLKEWLDHVWIVDFEQVEVILQESEWKGFFPEEWLNNGEEDCNGKKE